MRGEGRWTVRLLYVGAVLLGLCFEYWRTRTLVGAVIGAAVGGLFTLLFDGMMTKAISGDAPKGENQNDS